MVLSSGDAGTPAPLASNGGGKVENRELDVERALSEMMPVAWCAVHVSTIHNSVRSRR